jgi:predicted metal-binding protein
LIRPQAGRGASAPVDLSCGTPDAVTHKRSGRVAALDPTIALASTGSKTGAAIVYVCITCRRAGEADAEPRPGAILAAATAEAAHGTEVCVRPVRCLANCTRGPSAAIRCNGSWSYVFGGLDVACANALVEGARMLARAADGILPWRGRPEPLKRGLIARVPPLDFEELNVEEDLK